MAPKTNCAPAKLAAALAYLQKSRVAHTIKDLEKNLPSATQINGMQVKDYIQALQDESKIRGEKIGSGNWYWSFVSDDKIARQRALEDAKVNYEKATAVADELKSKLIEAEAQRKIDDEAVEDGGQTREELLGVKRQLELESEAIRRELAMYSDNDPIELEKKAREAAEWKVAAEECTDDIYSMEGWLKEAIGAGGEGLAAMLESIYDKEYDAEAKTLRELV
ncbi:hypothetical protein Q7P37_002848 [Cladosporium fusiforme]